MSIMTMVVVGWRMVSLIQSEAFEQLMYLNRSISIKNEVIYTGLQNTLENNIL